MWNIPQKATNAMITWCPSITISPDIDGTRPSPHGISHDISCPKVIAASHRDVPLLSTTLEKAVGGKSP